MIMFDKNIELARICYRFIIYEVNRHKINNCELMILKLIDYEL